MASNLGGTPIRVEFNGNEQGLTRAIWYVRYIDWVITTPALLLSLVLATGLPLSDIMALIFFDEVMIITGLVGALVASTYKVRFFPATTCWYRRLLIIGNLTNCLVGLFRLRLRCSHLHLGHSTRPRSEILCRPRT